MEGEEYREAVLDHYKNPRNTDSIDEPDLTGISVNDSCGDRVVMDIKVSGDKVEEVSQSSEGCMVSRAFASIVSEMLKGCKISDLEVINEKGFFDFVGFEPRKARESCAKVSFFALKDGLKGL